MAHALSLESVTVAFGIYLAVASTTFHVKQGEFVSVVGPTGCGKSTLLSLTAGLRAPNSGVVRVDGTPLSGLKSRAGYLFHPADSTSVANTADSLEGLRWFDGSSKASADGS